MVTISNTNGVGWTLRLCQVLTMSLVWKRVKLQGHPNCISDIVNDRNGAARMARGLSPIRNRLLKNKRGRRSLGKVRRGLDAHLEWLASTLRAAFHVLGFTVSVWGSITKSSMLVHESVAAVRPQSPWWGGGGGFCCRCCCVCLWRRLWFCTWKDFFSLIHGITTCHKKKKRPGQVKLPSQLRCTDDDRLQ